MGARVGCALASSRGERGRHARTGGRWPLPTSTQRAFDQRPYWTLLFLNSTSARRVHSPRNQLACFVTIARHMASWRCISRTGFGPHNGLIGRRALLVRVNSRPPRRQPPGESMRHERGLRRLSSVPGLVRAAGRARLTARAEVRLGDTEVPPCGPHACYLPLATNENIRIVGGRSVPATTKAGPPS